VDRGRRALSQELVASLRDRVEQVAWPRYWRFVDAMPVNQQGKTTATELAPLFEDSNRPCYPRILESSLGNSAANLPDEVSISFIVPHDLLYLEGHFPGKPILPGVVQIGWAIHYSREYLGCAGDFSRLEALKFQRVIQPGERIALNLKLDRSTNKLTFKYASGDTSHSGGRIVFTGAT
jgi:3-hydroxymyristoyl/3-hydroxydecanoyl-(acyl carrier protein) dehydratase